MRLFCFTFAGGTAAAFFDWNKRFSERLEVCAIEYPGRGRRWKEDPFQTLEDLVQALAGELRPDLDEPYALLGHSFGAIVAFEFARLAKKRSFPMPVRLLVSAARAPQLPLQESIHHLPDAEFLDRLKSYGGVPQEALDDKEIVSLMLPIVRNDFKLYERYSFEQGEPLPIPITVLGGMQDRKLPAADVLAWSAHTTKSFRSYFYPGNHFFLFNAQCEAFDDIYKELENSTSRAGHGGAV